MTINPSTLSQVQDLCTTKETTNDPLVMGIVGYQNITDEMCVYWNDAWTGDERNYAKAACFSGNYNYQLLKAFGLSNETEIHIHSTNFEGDNAYIDKADWALGAAIDSVETCDYADSSPSSSNTYTYGEVVEVGTGSGAVGLFTGGVIVFAFTSLYNKYKNHISGDQDDGISLAGKEALSDI